MSKLFLSLSSCLNARQVFYFVAVGLAVLSLKSCSGDESDPQRIVDKTIRVNGGEKYLHSTIQFDFRGRHYIATRSAGVYSYERVFKDSTSTVHDFLTNSGFIRERDNQRQAVADSMAKKYAASVNSVIYFALLPYGLNDPSVNKKFVGTTTLEGQPYYKIDITFGPLGGEDYEDAFSYWIHKEAYTIDYMAYSFEEDGIWDIRFRKAIIRRAVGGIVFQDYINYKPRDTSRELKDVEGLFTTGQLEELSRIELENIIVK